jgi:NADPH:quinone reductase-like Zn-dependent oxidoreductase
LRVIEIRDRFGLDNLRPAERAEPEPGAGQILLRMRAASLNYRDLLTVTGHYNPKQPLPLIPCSDGVGEVVATGPGTSRFARGDRVSPIFAQRWLSGRPVPERLRSTLGGPLDGTLSELMLLHEDGAVSVPEHLSDEEAAALPCAAVTAWSAVVIHGEVQAGDVVLVQGTGGVSIFALQFSRMMGARVIATSSSDAKLQRARELGAWETINYGETPEWGRRARKLTGGDGVDLVVEVGGAGTLAQSLAAVRFGGRIGLIGNLAGGETRLNLISILMRQIRVQGILVGHREGFESMNRAIAANAIRPVVDRVFPVEQARQALEHLQAGRHFGKVCLTFDAWR